MQDNPKELFSQLSALLTAYAKDIGDEASGIGEAAIRDALTDLRHLCDSRGFDFAEIDGAAYEVYLEEAMPVLDDEGTPSTEVCVPAGDFSDDSGLAPILFT